MRDEVLNVLIEKSGEFVSGEQLSKRLGVTRAAVWKSIKELERQGIVIEAVQNRGYRLIKLNNQLFPQYISKYLKTETLGQTLYCFESVGSTNLTARELAQQGCKEGSLVIADCQTAGKGRLGRKWISPPGSGVWMSIVLRPPIPPEHASRLTLVVALAVCKAITALGLDSRIKWPNDLLIRGKKVCGILLEVNSNMDRVEYIVAGMGINVNTRCFPEEIAATVTSLSLELKKDLDRQVFAASVMNYLEPLYYRFISGAFPGIMEEYKRNSDTLGKSVTITGFDSKVSGVVEDFDSDGMLLLRKEDGSLQKVASGDVSLKRI